MSQSSSLNIYFVLEDEEKDTEPSNDMNEAFAVIKEYKGKPQWVRPSFCLNHSPGLKDVFVFQHFQGPAFKKLKEKSAKIIGAKCMLNIVSAGDSIPPGKAPIFSEAMRGLVVCTTGLTEIAKRDVKEKVEYMSGHYNEELRSATTHVVVGNALSNKTVAGWKNGQAMVKLEWVSAVWERCQEDVSVKAISTEFNAYKAKIFSNLTMSTSGVARREKERLLKIITQNGGELSGLLKESTTDILLINIPEGEKYTAARKWKIKCVKPEWVFECAKKGAIIGLKNYVLGDDTWNKVSTPEKGDVVNLTANFSHLSAITTETDIQRNVTHVNETLTTADISLSQKQSVNVVIDKLMSDMRSAGQFLDGCNIYLAGFSVEQLDKLRKLLNYGGATRCDELTASVTHIIANGSLPKSSNDFGARVLKIDWLAQCVDLGRPAPVENYLLVGSREAPPSPLSKQGALLLARPEPVPIPEDDPPPPPEDDLLNRYNLSQQGEPLSQRQSERNTPAKLPSPRTSCSMKSESTYAGNLFSGRKFYLSPEIIEEDRISLEELLTQDGGVVVSSKYSGVVDYAIVPIVAEALTEVVAREVVSVLFIRDCLCEKAIVPIQYFHMPITQVPESRPLQGCVMSVSQYAGSERDYVESLIDSLGGVVQAILARKAKPNLCKTTHLILVEPTGQKYEGALRWSLPIVHHDWLIACAEKGVRVSEVPYLIGNSKLPDSNNTTASTNATPIVKSARKVHNIGSEQKSSAPIFTEPTPVAARSLSKALDNADSLQKPHRTFEPTPGSAKNVSKASSFENPHNIAEFSARNLSKALDDADCVENAPPEPTPGTSKNISRGSLLERAHSTAESTPRSLSKENLEKGITSAETITRNNSNRFSGLERAPSTAKSSPVVARKRTLDFSQSRTSEEMNASQSVARKEPLEVSQTKTPNYDSPSHFNKNLERVRQMATPNNLENSQCSTGTATPTSPYGAFYGNDNPSPGTRKRLYRWMRQGADFPLDADSPKPKTPKPSTPTGEYLSRYITSLMPRKDETSPPAKRQTLTPSQESAKNNLFNGLQKMRDIEQSYAKTSNPPASPAKSSIETANQMVIVAQSQPHTEIGWEDPTEKETGKIFMLSGLADRADRTKELIESCGGKVSPLGYFDKDATHIIATSATTRAEKLMGSVAGGLWVLHPSYIDQLEIVKNVNALKEEDFEWGNPNSKLPAENISKTLRECLVSAYYWRMDLKANKPPPFHGMNIILRVSESKKDSFGRLVEVGGGNVVSPDTTLRDQVLCLCDSSLPSSECEAYFKKNITCVSLIFLNDVILRKPNPVQNNIFQLYAQLQLRNKS